MPRGVVIAALVVTAAIGRAGAEEIGGTVETVLEGDRFRLQGRTVRLWGIDAPEMDQPCLPCLIDGGEYACGEWARRMLERIVRDRTITCETMGDAGFGATVATCSFPIGVRSKQDIGGTMVSRGWAVDHYPSSDGEYSGDQYRARMSRHGLWAGSFKLPWKWRRGDP